MGGYAEMRDHLGKQGRDPRYSPRFLGTERRRVVQEDVPTNNQLGNLNSIWNLHLRGSQRVYGSVCIVVAVAARVTQAKIPCNNEQQKTLLHLVRCAKEITLRANYVDNAIRLEYFGSEIRRVEEKCPQPLLVDYVERYEFRDYYATKWKSLDKTVSTVR
jgi:hypothetical protein